MNENEARMWANGIDAGILQTAHNRGVNSAEAYTRAALNIFGRTMVDVFGQAKALKLMDAAANDITGFPDNPIVVEAPPQKNMVANGITPGLMSAIKRNLLSDVEVEQHTMRAAYSIVRQDRPFQRLKNWFRRKLGE